MCVSVCACVCVYARSRAFVCACVCVCVRVSDVFAHVGLLIQVCIHVRTFVFSTHMGLCV